MKTPKKRPGRRNAIAATLSQGCFRKRVEAKKTGRGSYRRQPKHRLAGGGLPFGRISVPREITTAA